MDRIFEAEIDNTKLKIKLSEDTFFFERTVEIVEKQINEIRNSSITPIEKEKVYLLAALNIAGQMLKEKDEVDDELNNKLDEINKAIDL